MNKNAIVILLSLLIIFSGFVVQAQTEKKPELLTKDTFLKKVWDFIENPKEFKYLGDKPCMIDFYADWCGPCRRIAPFMDDLSQSYAKDIYVYKINIDQQKELAALFKATNIPLVIFIPMKGQPASAMGAQPKDIYEKYVREILLGKTSQ
jgi:thioredoxin